MVFAPLGDELLARQLSRVRSEGGDVHRISAPDVVEPADLFRAFARRLNFPGYFGHNWDALVDCLSDEHVVGHGARRTVVVIEAADCLLAMKELPRFVSVLSHRFRPSRSRRDW